MTLLASYGIHHTLQSLIEEKSKRDRVKFTIYQLAKALDMPHTVLLRIMHPDPSKRVSNPKIDTLAKIVAFFRADGFNITIDDLLAGLKSKAIDIQEQELEPFNIQMAIPLYSLDARETKKISTINIRLTKTPKNAIAFCSDENIKPMFKKGSIFIVDTNITPQNDMLVAVKLEYFNKIQIRKFLVQDNINILQSLNPEEKPIILMPTVSFKILGVVIQINAKT